eukprot:scpid76180/ scgid35268/ Cytoplasmic dynein 1 light intermediate chain 2; Dynein light intermediate chain 2, cytosolic
MLDKTKGKDAAVQDDLWSSILNDVRTSSAPRQRVAAKNLLIVGDVNSGKNSVVTRLRHKDASSGPEVDEARGCGMEYTYVDVNYEDFDDVYARLGVWILDGDEKYQPLLNYCLNEKSIDTAVAMVVVDLSKPWTVLSSLQRWLSVLGQHINSLKIDPKQRKEMEEKQVKFFQSYTEPTEASPAGTGPAAGAAGSTTAGTGADDEKVLLPLGEDVLVENLGIPIVIVAAKSDAFAQLEKEDDYSEEHFDFIQLQLRRVCLKYGASLVYVSSKDSRNCDLLYSYLIHVAYDLPFKDVATVVDRDAIFVPMGWDSGKKIALLQEQMTTMSADDTFEERIPEPPSRKPAQDQVPVTAEADQIFLLRQQAHLGIPAASGGSAPPRAGDTPAQRVPAANNRSPRTERRAPAPATTASAASAVAAGGTGETVLASFFQSLLQKKPGAAGGRTPGQPATGSASPAVPAGDKSQPKKS